MEVSKVKCLIWDHGLQTQLAEKLAEAYDTVWYFVPTSEAFPTSKVGMIGTGLPNIERVFDFWDYVKDADLIVFPDVYDGDVQEYLRGLGKPVWGSGRTEQLELDRWHMHQMLKQLDLPAPHAERVEGIDALRDLLQEVDDVYVKTSYFRGDFETFHHVTYELSELWLDEIQHSLGPRGKVIQFIVEDPVDGVEVGYDGYHVNGTYGPLSSFGYEVKDAGFLGQVRLYEEMPEPIKLVLDSLSPSLNGVSAHISNELRIGKDKQPYLIDPCQRMAMPPSASLLEVFDNWSEVILAGAQGDLVSLEAKGGVSHFAEVILESSWAEKDWLPVSIKAGVRAKVKLRNKLVLDGQDYVATLGYPHFGSAVGYGSSTEAAIADCMKTVKGIEALELHHDEHAFEKALDQVEEGEANGIDWR